MPHAALVRVRIVDGAGVPISGRVTVTVDGRPVDPVILRGGLGWRTRRQSFVVGPEERAAYVHAGQSELGLPPGRVALLFTRGHMRTPVRREFTLQAGEEATVDVALERWRPSDGWVCGDLHLHFARLHPDRDAAIRALFEAEDLDVAGLVDWAGRANGRSGPGWGGWAWSPELLAEGSTNGPGNSLLVGQGWGRPDRACVLSLFGHTTPVRGASRYSAAAIVEEVIAEGGLAVGTMGHVPADGALLSKVRATEVLSHGRLDGLERWYALLNVGARVAAVAGSDVQSASWPQTLTDYHTPPGASRVCVAAEDATLGAFLSGIADGRTYVTSGPFLSLEIEGHGPGATLDAEGPRALSIELTMQAPIAPQGTLRVIRNGETVWTHELTPTERTLAVTIQQEVSEPSWFAARLEGSERIPGGDLALAHTSPVYVRLAGRDVFVPSTVSEVLAMLPDIDAIAESGNSTAHERETALLWVRDARALLERRATSSGPR